MSRPRVEILYFGGCPHQAPTRQLVAEIARELELEPDIELVEVNDDEAAQRMRFLGSPTVRINGRDVEPGADGREGTFALSCRVYRDERGLAGRPSRKWIRDALSQAAAGAVALAAAEIPRDKQGSERGARLTASERALYTWILRRFRTGRPNAGELHREAERCGLEPDAALSTLAREDLVHLGRAGEVAVAYPFSGLETAHVVTFADGHKAFAMCAIDALGTAPMFGEPVEIRSRDPLTGERLHGRLTADGEMDWQPRTAVVVAGVSDRQGESLHGCCPVLNFFASADNGHRWLEQHPAVRGTVVSLADAVAAGRAVFGDVLSDELRGEPRSTTTRRSA
jgi:hypothetical protein